MNTINVRDYGAQGDGQTDDTESIQRAVALLQPKSTLYFPVGTYRIATQGTLVDIQGVSGLRVVFDSSAVLLMDNLDEKGLGSGHAFYFRGYADSLLLDGIHIEWKTKPAQRSMGDGIRLDGPYSKAGPSDQLTIKNIVINNCYVARSPQAGIILMGCSDIIISNITLDSTRADGVHLNACRRFTIENVVGQNLEDDQVALVTYYNPSKDDYTLGNRMGGPYTQPLLGEWSNYQGKINNVISNANKRLSANGIRIAGAYNVSVNNLKAYRRKASIIIDAGKKGNTFGWEYQASKQIRVSNVTASECHVGVHVMSFNVSPTDRRYWDFDLSLDEIAVEDCKLDNLLVEKCSGVTIDHVESRNGRIRIINTSNISMGSMRNQKGNILIHGLTAIAQKMNLSPIPISNITIDSVTVLEGNIQLANIIQLAAGYLYADSKQSETGCTLVNIRKATINSLVVRFAKKYGTRILKCQSLIVISTFIEADQRQFVALEVGGGDATSISENITLVSVTYNSVSGNPDVRIQSGPHAPKQVSMQVVYGDPLTKTMSKKQYRLN